MTTLSPPAVVTRFRPSEPMWMRCSKGHLVAFEGNPSLLCTDCMADQERRDAIKAKDAERKEKRRQVRKEKREANSGTKLTVAEVLDEFVRLHKSLTGDALGHAADSYSRLLSRVKLLQYGTKRSPYTVEELAVGARVDLIEAVEASRLAKDDSKKPWAYLRGKPEAQAAWERFDAALTEARASGEGVPRCENDPAPYTDFGGEGFDHGDDLPTSEEAYMLCAECPLLELCGNWAELERRLDRDWETIPKR